MSKADSSMKPRGGRISDARGRQVTQLDPVRLHLLKQHSIIPSDTLRSMTDALLPGARRQRLVQLISVGLGFLVVVGGTLIYFRYFSTWKGFDPVNTTIYVIQFAVIVSGPVIAFRIARARYVNRVMSVMLEFNHCPYCGYCLQGLIADSNDGATVCPECGCAWRMPSRTEHEARSC